MTLLTASPKMRAAVAARAAAAPAPAPVEPLHAIAGELEVAQPTPPAAAPPAKGNHRARRKHGRRIQQRLTAAEWVDANAVIAVMQERWPAAFCETARRPLAIGIGKILAAELVDVSPRILSGVLHYWTARRDYLIAVAAGEARCNLDGSPASAASETDRAAAARLLKTLHGYDVATRASTQKPAGERA